MWRMANEANKLELIIKIIQPRFFKNVKFDLALLPKWDPFTAPAS